MKKKEQHKDEDKPKKPQESEISDFDKLLKAVLDLPPPPKKKRKEKGQ